MYMLLSATIVGWRILIAAFIQAYGYLITIINQDMILIHITLSLLILSVNSAVVLNPITGIAAKNLMYTGTIQVGGQKLFFTFYGMDGQTSPDNLPNNPLVICVGTPGRSAQYINVAGIGPKSLNPDASLVDNANRATQFGNVMFIDLLGSGFSFASSAAAIPKAVKDHASILTKAINSFTSETSIGKSTKILLIGESNFVRALPGFDDIAGLLGIVHVSPWFDLYGLGQFYGAAGVEMKIFTNSERVTIESTFVNCYNFQTSKKFIEAHNCYDTTLNYVQNKTSTRNLYNIQKMSNLTEFLPMTQFYFSQASVVSAYKAPNSALFESQSAQTFANVYEDLGRNIDSTISQYLKDNLSVKQVFLAADDDFISFRKGIKNWVESSISFLDSAKFKPLNLTEYTVNGKVVGYRKSVPQVAYYELLNSGHFSYSDQPSVISAIVKQLTSSSSEHHLRGSDEHIEHHHREVDGESEEIRIE